MKNSKTTFVGLLIGALIVAFGVLQPFLTGGETDLKLIIPAVVVAVVMYLQKDNGNWQTTTVYAILAALGAAASAMVANPGISWIVVIGSALTALGGSLTKDHDKDTTTTIKV